MNSIRSRLTASILTGVFLLSMIAGAVLLYVIRGRLATEFDRGLETKARTMVALTTLEERRIEIDFDDDLMPEFDGEDEDEEGGEEEEGADEDEEDSLLAEEEDEDDHPVAREYFSFYLPNGVLVAKSPSLGKGQRLIANHDDLSERLVSNVVLPDGRPGRMIQLRFPPKIELPDPDEVDKGVPDADEIRYDLPANIDEKKVGLVLLVAQGRERLDSLLVMLNWTVALVIGLLLVGIGLLVRLSVRVGFRPIEELNMQMKRVGPESLDERLSLPEAADELTEVVAALNSLLERVESGFNRERRFTSDVAHELRTPVAELLTACEVGAKWPEDPLACRLLFEDIRDVAQQMGTVIETLLELVRCENGTTTAALGPVRLRRLVDDCWAHINGRAESKGVTLDNEIGADLAVESDEEKLRMIVQNLLDNAVEHGAPRGVISCRSTRVNGTIDFILQNEAENLEAKDLPSLFERFWQGDTARSATDRFGLGLSIVKALSGVLGHPIRASMRGDSIFEVQLQFPNASRGGQNEKARSSNCSERA